MQLAPKRKFAPSRDGNNQIFWRARAAVFDYYFSFHLKKKKGKMNEKPQLEEETLSIITLIHLLDARALFKRERIITIDYKNLKDFFTLTRK